jgi:Mg/Co/Ni transporter MgtE
MSTRAITLRLPGPLYQRLDERATKNQRTIEDEAVTLLASALWEAEAESPELAQVLDLLDDETLWRAARHWLADEAADALKELHRKRQREGLTECESQTVAELLSLYKRQRRIRSHAATLLKKRGHDVSSLSRE